MQKTYQEEMLLRTSNCDFMGTWRPSAIFEAMQEASGMHSHLLGCGRDVLIEKGIVWVLSRVEVQMEKYPRIGDRVTVETFPVKNRRWFFPRYFVFKDEQGNRLGYACSLWVLLDISTRKMAPPDVVLPLIPDNSDLTPPMGLPATVMEAGGLETEAIRQPAYTDLDVNFHVNNARYMDWLCDALGWEVLEKRCLASVCINYDAEVRPDQEVKLALALNGDAFSLFGYHDGKRHFEIGGFLRDRQ